MLFKRIESEGIAHYSYIVGDRGEAAVIDPRRDTDVYLDEALKQGYRITRIFETHRNEDYVVGSRQLSAATGAKIYRADSQLGYKYGEKVKDGQKWKVGALELGAIHTPGHTPGHMSYLLRDHAGAPWVVFTGDTLFSGDVGRTDLLGKGQARKMAKMLHNSIFNKLFPLGDGVIVCPAHGAGSVCGASISERTWTTIGIERNSNPKLRSMAKGEFVERAAHMLERPPYFRKMEKMNLNPPLLKGSAPPPLGPERFSSMMKGAIVLDTRSEVAFGGAHIPGSLSIWQDGLPMFAGWMLPYNRPILLVCPGTYPSKEIRALLRLGYEDVRGYLSGGMLAWHMAGKRSSSISTIPVHEFCRQLDEKKMHILDVRSDGELENEGRIHNAQHIHITRLPENIGKVPKKPVSVFCGSGMRSMIAASLLRMKGHRDVSVILGGTAAWESATCPIEIIGD